MIRRLLALLVALTLAGVAHAGGARDALLLSAPPASTTPIYNGPGLAQGALAFVVNSASARTGTFSGAPAVGDLLVAGCFGTNNPVDAVAGSGWTAISSSVAGANTRGRLFTYLYVVTPGVSSYTPCTNPATGTSVATVIFDINGANATWATAFQSPITEGTANSTGPASCGASTAANNTLALGFGASDTNGGSIFTDMTFTGLTTGKVTPGTSTTNNYAGGAYGTFVPKGNTASLTTSGVWSGGAGGSSTICELVRLNP